MYQLIIERLYSSASLQTCLTVWTVLEWNKPATHVVLELTWYAYSTSCRCRPCDGFSGVWVAEQESYGKSPTIDTEPQQASGVK